MVERRHLRRRGEDAAIEEIHRWVRRAAVGYAILMAAIVVGFFRVGSEVEENAAQAVQIELQAEALRIQSIAGCRRANEVRYELRVARNVLRELVTEILRAGGPSNPLLREPFIEARDDLRRRIARVPCARAYREP